MNALDQAETWTDADGVVHMVAKMERRHAANVAALLARTARWRYDRELAGYLWGPQPGGDMACDAFAQEVARLMEQTPEEWLRGQPLYRALVERAAGHPGGPSRRWVLRHPARGLRDLLRVRVLGTR